MGENWYNLEVEESMKKLKTSAKGLKEKEAKKRLEQYGPNRIKEQKGKSPVLMFLGQFTDFMVLVLIAATVISVMLGEIADAVTILAIIILNAVLGFIQEFRAEKSMEALKQLTAPEAKVMRNGEETKIPAAKLVPGDIIILDTGDRIPADCRLLEGSNLQLEESALTGESVPVKKVNSVITDNRVALGDQENMLFMGTSITRGRGHALVVGTGMNTEMGNIAGMMQEVGDSETPLQRRLAGLGRWLVFFCILVCVVVVVTGILRGEPVYRMFLAGVSLAVAAIPEGLPAIVTVALAIGVQKMIRRNAVVRRLPAVETLGCATVICSDKTGTLTQNQMTVRRLWLGKEHEVSGDGYEPKGEFSILGKRVKPKGQLETALKIAAVCNNSNLTKNGIKVGGLFRKKESTWHINGDPTEGALLVMAAKGGIWRESVEKKEQRIYELPFDSDRKRMTVVMEDGKGNRTAYTKGAPDVILKRCSHFLQDGEVRVMDSKMRDVISDENTLLAGQALRVLALAYRPADRLDEEELESEMVFVGLAGMIDPPRPAAVKAIDTCKQAGIMPVMITGDHQATAWAIAREMGLLTGDKKVLTGNQLDLLSDQDLAGEVEQVAVYARVSPQHKLRIVRALKDKGHVVAMTGDGVNDAPAVKEADIGVAMGKTGTDVTREASDMVLTDDNFATIVAAIEEGRAIYDNIRKFIRYLLSCNVGEVLTMFFAALAGLPLPLLPIQILWVNLVTDGLPAMALGVDNADKDVMLRSPRHPKESIFSRGLASKIMSRGFQIGLGTLLVFTLGVWLGDGELAAARTMAFATLVFSQLFHVFDCKSERYSLFQVGVFSNSFLVIAVTCSVIMQLSVIYLPFFQPIFKTVPLNLFHWCVILLAAGWRTFGLAIYHYAWRPLARRLVFLKA
ncbi:calcium-transporting P-type ATPase, PMR1-type [Metallumcola ferriviriculae]|uniref:P-type Ca(2+) transporter n=1 Tax=Metallumcola ferriviriculae TaxID=3039180 RepID=A0AAU0UMR3_9FIRM|nr:calcium-transporting P-type ATPase, PMR1-type [Desulfitibacteraceae bacterium MK1]